MEQVGSIRAEGGGTMEELMAFLREESGEAALPLESRGGTLRSYGVVIAQWEEGKIRLVKVAPQKMTPVRWKHVAWVKGWAREKGIEVIE